MLKGKTVNLRTIRSRDLDPLLDLMSDVESQGEFFPVPLMTETKLRERFAKDGYWSDDMGLLLIVTKEDDRILGTVARFRPIFYLDSIEFGYILYDVSMRGKGIVTEAVNLLLDYTFRTTRTHRVDLKMDARNIASVRVAEKCGFKLEYTSRTALVGKNELDDEHCYVMFREDWEQKRLEDRG